MSKRIIYYYQTFCGLGDLLKLKNQPVTHIHLSSIHFGYNKDESCYIHLNDHAPSDSKFTKVWEDIAEAQKKGIKIVLMIGGAGGGYKTLFENYDECYKLLKSTLILHPEITGINLDIEEFVDMDNVVWFVGDIQRDFPHFEISFAPMASSLQSDQPGMGGFVYKDLSKQIYIDYYNVQFYGEFTAQDFNLCVQNGYSEDSIVMGMMADPDTLKSSLKVLQTVSQKYPKIGGAFVWEYYDSYQPPKWAQEVDKVFSATEYLCLL